MPSAPKTSVILGSISIGASHSDSRSPPSPPEALSSSPILTRSRRHPYRARRYTPHQLVATSWAQHRWCTAGRPLSRLAVLLQSSAPARSRPLPTRRFPRVGPSFPHSWARAWDAIYGRGPGSACCRMRSDLVSDIDGSSSGLVNSRLRSRIRHALINTGNFLQFSLPKMPPWRRAHWLFTASQQDMLILASSAGSRLPGQPTNTNPRSEASCGRSHTGIARGSPNRRPGVACVTARCLAPRQICQYKPCRPCPKAPEVGVRPDSPPLPSSRGGANDR